MIMPVGLRNFGPASLKIGVPSALPHKMREKVRELSSFTTEAEHRGHGFARDLMAQVCFEADLSGTWLFLHVDPEDDTDRTRLANFYLSCGFEPIQAEPLLMIRRCVSDAITATFKDDQSGE